MKPTKYIRKRKTIRTVETGEVKTYESIALAKKASRGIQLAEDGGLGRGSLMVEG